MLLIKILSTISISLYIIYKFILKKEYFNLFTVHRAVDWGSCKCPFTTRDVAEAGKLTIMLLYNRLCNVNFAPWI